MFDSCSAYQDSRPHILFLAHCVPNPPDKGEKIRAHHALKALAAEYRIHLACFARSPEEVRQAKALSKCCESVHVELLRPKLALARAGVRFLAGACLNEAFYRNERLRRRVNDLAGRVSLAAAFVFTCVMAPYVPPGLPVLLDMNDVDSEKWFEYGQRRRPGFLYRTEARRLQVFERDCANQANQIILTTDNEASVLGRIAPGATALGIENGVDGDFFDGRHRQLRNELAGSQFVAFVGSMDYYPNVEAVVRFAREVFPELRRRIPALEFFIVGRNPDTRVLKLRNEPNIRVLGGVPDVRPYLSSASAIVVPLQLARGIQNKVLEALAMGRKVLASDAVCRTFGGETPPGVVRCESSDQFVISVLHECGRRPQCDEHIRRAAQTRFSWDRNMNLLKDHLAATIKPPVPVIL